MPKRKNPFDDLYFPQKMHVGIKEVNLGVNHVENMKRVYENTMKLLYNKSVTNQNGSPKLHNGALFKNGNPVLQKEISHVNGKGANGMLQLCTSNKQEKVVLMNPCCKSNMSKHCSFCEKIMCNICRRICKKCNNEFCHLCSILQYDSLEETAMCLSCI